jgi:PadR family transcriptional regulator, regulatory protein AphA
VSLRHAILGFLTIRPLSGYDLKRAFDSSVRHFWTADQAAIYRALTELERDGFVLHERVAQSARPDRKVHHATEAGREELARWLRGAMPVTVRREPLLLKLFFADALHPEVMRDIVDGELAQVDEELAAFEAYAATLEARAATASDADRRSLLGPLITLTNGVQLGHAYRRWLAGLSALAHESRLTVEHVLPLLKG